EEILACQEHLFQQIEIIKPTIICTLGTYATSLLLGNEKFQISKIRGKLLTGRKGYKIFPTYHPSYLLRNPSQKRFAIEDFQTLSNLLKEIHETK
ncbi:MAG: uracil-DNA glycosylase, partial [candidate division WOR-3 bacterium]